MTNSAVTVQGGTLLGSGTVSKNVTLSSGALAGTLAIGGSLTVTGNSTWYAQDTVSGGATVQSGLFTLASGGSLSTSTLNVTGGAIAAAAVSSTLNGSLNYASSTNSNFFGVISGVSSTVTLNNPLALLQLLGLGNTYGGLTTVSAGTLTFNELTNSSVSVQGGTLDAGLIYKNVTVSSGRVCAGNLRQPDDYRQ